MHGAITPGMVSQGAPTPASTSQSAPTPGVAAHDARTPGNVLPAPDDPEPPPPPLSPPRGYSHQPVKQEFHPPVKQEFPMHQPFPPTDFRRSGPSQGPPALPPLPPSAGQASHLPNYYYPPSAQSSFGQQLPQQHFNSVPPQQYPAPPGPSNLPPHAQTQHGFPGTVPALGSRSYPAARGIQSRPPSQGFHNEEVGFMNQPLPSPPRHADDAPRREGLQSISYAPAPLVATKIEPTFPSSSKVPTMEVRGSHDVYSVRARERSPRRSRDEHDDKQKDHCMDESRAYNRSRREEGDAHHRTSDTRRRSDAARGEYRDGERRDKDREVDDDRHARRSRDSPERRYEDRERHRDRGHEDESRASRGEEHVVRSSRRDPEDGEEISASQRAASPLNRRARSSRGRSRSPDRSRGGPIHNDPEGDHFASSRETRLTDNHNQENLPSQSATHSGRRRSDHFTGSHSFEPSEPRQPSGSSNVRDIGGRPSGSPEQLSRRPSGRDSGGRRALMGGIPHRAPPRSTLFADGIPAASAGLDEYEIRRALALRLRQFAPLRAIVMTGKVLPSRSGWVPPQPSERVPPSRWRRVKHAFADVSVSPTESVILQILH